MISKSPPVTCARYHVDGSRAPRCGSLASIGLPLAVSVPSTTQLFEPIASARAPPRRKSLTAASPPASARVNAVAVGETGWAGFLSRAKPLLLVGPAPPGPPPPPRPPPP